VTLIFAVTMLSGFSDQWGARFDTITVQRINVVEPDGTLRMVLTNNRRLPGVIQHGKEYPDFADRKGRTTAGILFYDAEGSESGGLTFGGRKDAQGNISRFGHFAFDRYEQDQMFTISASDNGTSFGSSIQLREVPGWSIVEYLDLLESIQHLPEAEQQAAINEFLETHPVEGFGARVALSYENDTDAAVAASALQFIDDDSNERLRAGVGVTAEPSVEFRDAAGNVTYSLPPGT
jgi:hypothetical protein